MADDPRQVEDKNKKAEHPHDNESFTVENKETGEKKTVTLKKFREEGLNNKGFSWPTKMVGGVEIDVETGAPVTPEGTQRAQNDTGTPSIMEVPVSNPVIPEDQKLDMEREKLMKDTLRGEEGDKQLSKDAAKTQAIKGGDKK